MIKSVDNRISGPKSHAKSFLTRWSSFLCFVGRISGAETLLCRYWRQQPSARLGPARPGSARLGPARSFREFGGLSLRSQRGPLRRDWKRERFQTDHHSFYTLPFVAAGVVYLGAGMTAWSRLVGWAGERHREVVEFRWGWAEFTLQLER